MTRGKHSGMAVASWSATDAVVVVVVVVVVVGVGIVMDTVFIVVLVVMVGNGSRGTDRHGRIGWLGWDQINVQLGML